MQIYLLLTEACNLKCNYCIRGDKRQNFLDKKALEKILEENDFTNDQVLLTGGEPMLHPQFLEIITLCSKKFKSISINTNGTILKYLEDMSLIPNLHIQISIDGVEEVHNTIRGEHSFSKIISVIENIERLGISYNIATVVNQGNKDTLKNMIKWLECRSMKYWKVEPQLPFGCGDNQLCITTEEWNIIVDELLEICDFRLVIKKLFDFTILNKCTQEQIKMLESRKVKNCGNCTQKVYVYPDFNVYPCTCLKEFKLGNLQENTLKQVLADDQATIFKEYKVLEESACSKCRYVKICNGGCIGMSYHKFKKLGMGDCRCPLVSKN